MAAHQYWRLTGFLTDSNALELSQAQLYDGSTLIAQAPTFSIAPTTGTAFPETLHWDDFSMPGFALTWNLATPVVNPSLRLGAGFSAATFPKEFYCQYSDDGLFWSTNNAPTNVAFPGAGLLTDEPGTGAVETDPDFSKVVFLLQDTLADQSDVANAVTAFGTAAMSSAQSKFGTSSLAISQTGDYLESPSSTNFGLPGDFTVEALVYITAFPATNFQPLLNIGTYSTGALFRVQPAKLEIYILGAELLFPVAVSAAAWHHVAWTRAAGVVRAFLDGVPAGGSLSNGSTIPANKLTVGTSAHDHTEWINGFVDGLRITKGLARYTAAFTPPATAFSNGSVSGASVFIPLSETAAPKRWRTVAKFPEPLVGEPLPEFAISEGLRGETFLDAYNGGRGRIRGTVAEKGTPNKLLHREVLLLDEASNVVIRKTWSDPVTGAY